MNRAGDVVSAVQHTPLNIAQHPEFRVHDWQVIKVCIKKKKKKIEM